MGMAPLAAHHAPDREDQDVPQFPPCDHDRHDRRGRRRRGSRRGLGRRRHARAQLHEQHRAELRRPGPRRRRRHRHHLVVVGHDAAVVETTLRRVGGCKRPPGEGAAADGAVRLKRPLGWPRLRIWVDMTAPAHPLVLRPLIERFRAAGHDVQVTARDYAQTLAILERLRIRHVAIGAHGGASRRGKMRALGDRSRRMIGFGRRGFDLALGHGSNDLALAAAALRVPAVNTFDYEWAAQQHNIGCRLARRVIVPEAIPPDRLRRYGVDARKLTSYPGLKEEYYLSDFTADTSVPRALGVDPDRVLVVLRPTPDVSLYHRKANRLFAQVLGLLGNREDVHAVVIPRTDQQRSYA